MATQVSQFTFGYSNIKNQRCIPKGRPRAIVSPTLITLGFLIVVYALILTTILMFGTSSTISIPIKIYSGDIACGIPSVGPGIYIFSPPSIAPYSGVLLQACRVRLTHRVSSGFTASVMSAAWGGDLPAFLTSEPLSLHPLSRQI